MQLLIMGPPGAGKGTQSRLIGDHFDIPAISTGEMFRSLESEDSPLAREVRATMATGGFVSDAVTDKIVARRISADDCAGGFILDGYPRTTEQAESLNRLLRGRGTALDAVISITVPEPVLIDRMLARAKIEHRADDTIEVITARFDIYRSETAPLLEMYRSLDLLLEIDGTGSVEEVASRATRALAALRH